MTSLFAQQYDQPLPLDQYVHIYAQHAFFHYMSNNMPKNHSFVQPYAHLFPRQKNTGIYPNICPINRAPKRSWQISTQTLYELQRINNV